MSYDIFSPMNLRTRRFFTEIAFLLASSMALEAQKGSECAAGLVPNSDVTNASSSAKASWLQLIDASNFYQAKEIANRSGDAEVVGIFEGNVKFEDFSFKERRDKYLAKFKGGMDRTEQLAYVRHLVPDSARIAFFNCVMGQHGINIEFQRETDDYLHFGIRYRSEPGGETKYTVTLVGGTLSGATPQDLVQQSIKHDGSRLFTVKRNADSKEVRVNVNTSSDLSDGAVSVRHSVVAAKCKSRNISIDDQVFATNRILRVEKARLSIAEDCSAILSFEAASMLAGIKIEGNNGPWLQFALKKGDGFLTEYRTVGQPVEVSQCAGSASGYRQHATILTSEAAPRAVLDGVTGFSLRMGGAASVPCSQ